MAFVCGRRTAANALETRGEGALREFPDVRFQLTTDGLQSYIGAVDEVLADRCDYAQLVKTYIQPMYGERHRSRRNARKR